MNKIEHQPLLTGWFTRWRGYWRFLSASGN